MTSRSLSLLLVLTLAAGANLAAAAPDKKSEMGAGPMMAQGHAGQQDQQGQRRQPPESFTEETTRKMADGRVFKSKLEQVVNENGLVRKEELTNPDGKTAKSTITVTIDKKTKIVTRKMEGVGFDGKAWSRSDEHDMKGALGQDAKPAERKKDR